MTKSLHMCLADITEAVLNNMIVLWSIKYLSQKGSFPSDSRIGWVQGQRKNVINYMDHISTNGNLELNIILCSYFECYIHFSGCITVGISQLPSFFSSFYTYNYTILIFHHLKQFRVIDCAFKIKKNALRTTLKKWSSQYKTKTRSRNV